MHCTDPTAYNQQLQPPKVKEREKKRVLTAACLPPPVICHGNAMPCHAMLCAVRWPVLVPRIILLAPLHPASRPARSKAKRVTTRQASRDWRFWPFMHKSIPVEARPLHLAHACWPEGVNIYRIQTEASLLGRIRVVISANIGRSCFSFFSLCFLPCPSRVICKHGKWPLCNCQQQHDRSVGFRASRWQHPPVREAPQIKPVYLVALAPTLSLPFQTPFSKEAS